MVFLYLILAGAMLLAIAYWDGELSPISSCLVLLFLSPLILAAGVVVGMLLACLFIIKTLSEEGRKIPCLR